MYKDSITQSIDELEKSFISYTDKHILNKQTSRIVKRYLSLEK